MDYRIFHLPILHFLFKVAGAIPVASQKEDPEMKNRAFAAVAEALANGEIVAIFPEGRITSDGNICPFRPGIEQIIKQTPVPVIPMALRGLWGSFFSRKHGGRAMNTWPRRLWGKIALVVGEPIPPEDVKLPMLEAKVRELRGDEQ